MMINMLRKLRIAFSAVCGIVCLLLIVLWVRSSYLGDTFELRTPFVRATVNSIRSRIGTGIGFGNKYGYERTVWWGVFPHERIGNLDEFASWRFRLLAVGDGFIVQAPHWFFIFISSVLAVLPWTRCKYSLRTLLVAMTLITLGLGLIVLVSR